MGNCQAAEAATVVIQHPNNKVDRLYCSVTARQVMASNPGHYVALVIGSPVVNGAPVKQLKLLRPDESLLIGHLYRLVTFQDVLNEYAAKKCARLGKLLKERGALPPPINDSVSALLQNPKPHSHTNSSNKEQEGVCSNMNNGGRSRGGGGGGGRSQQWKPALQSISEVGT